MRWAEAVKPHVGDAGAVVTDEVRVALVAVCALDVLQLTADAGVRGVDAVEFMRTRPATTPTTSEPSSRPANPRRNHMVAMSILPSDQLRFPTRSSCDTTATATRAHSPGMKDPAPPAHGHCPFLSVGSGSSPWRPTI